MPDRFEVHPIGTVRCAVTEMSQGGWAKVDSEIHLDSQYARGLQGLDGFSHVIVVFFLDRADDAKTPPWVGRVMEGYF